VALLSDDLPVRLVVAGDDRFVPAKKSAPVRASLDRISDRVDLVGWIDRERFHASVDLVVVPSTWDEPFGLVAAEAMARRSPLVVTDAGALPEIVGPNYPWIAPRSDPQKLATVLRRMLDNPALVGATVEQAHRRWSREFSPAAGVTRMENLLASLR
jgi:glycosyltransferase involved in cell wall biosynthesis